MKTICLRMNISAILTFFCIIQMTAATGFGQEKITIEVKNASLEEVIDEIKSQTEYRFFFERGVIDLSRRLTLKVSNKSVENVLSTIFRDEPIAFTILKDQIVFTKDPPEKLQFLMPPALESQFVSIVTELPSLNSVKSKVINGIVTDRNGEVLIGVNILVKGTTRGTVTDFKGKYSIQADEEDILVFSYVGYRTVEVPINNQTYINIQMAEDVERLDELVVVGYGVQKESDITGSVASLSRQRLEMVPNVNINQAIQGSMPGVAIQTSSAGARPSESLMIRGRNSITASNAPLVVVDGIPYNGNINDINPNNVESIDILKDASAAAIYGSRGSNGVIIITTKEGAEGDINVSYNGNYSFQNYTNLPELLSGQEFYEFKRTREPGVMFASEQANYDAQKWTNWYDVGIRSGQSHQHTLSVSGGFKNTTFYLSGGLLDVQGLAINDDYLRASTRINIDTRISDWLSIGTRTQLSFNDLSGVSPNFNTLYHTNPLGMAYDDQGELTILPVQEYPVANPLQETLYENIDKYYQVVTNNFAIIEIPNIQGLKYKINTGINFRTAGSYTYQGRNTLSGRNSKGSAAINHSQLNNFVVENILTYQKSFEKHNLFATGLLSYESNNRRSESMRANDFPHDILNWYSIPQAEVISPSYSINETTLISQMLRLNYSYDSRYLLTVTARRDGYSGFGQENKWGIFPSVALGWNLTNESFFHLNDLFSKLKLRASYGLNGNQGIGAYQTQAAMTASNYVDRNSTLPGYSPGRLGVDNLGWESSRTLNVGLDFGLLEDRIYGDINVFKSNTFDLLLNRSISPVHGFSSITQNIGETLNKGMEFSISTRNVVAENFMWTTNGNMSFIRNEIVALYGERDDAGNEIDDVGSGWFIGQPITVNYDYVWAGTWQSYEADEAALYGSQPGFVKLMDVNGDGQLGMEDRQIIGQSDPRFIWGLNNAFSYKNFTINLFVHGVHGMTKRNFEMTDLNVNNGVNRNTTRKNWWTPDNPTNEWVMNDTDAEYMSGIQGHIYDDASFIRIKDLSLSYESDLLKKVLNRLRLYVTARNLFTFSNWRGLDPEISDQTGIPLQKEFVIGVDFEF